MAPGKSCYGDAKPAMPPTTKCYGDKIKMQHIKSRASEVEPKPVESIQERTDNQERIDRVKESAPEGFHELLQKVLEFCFRIFSCF